MKLTAIIPTGNEAHNIEAVIKSVNFADEIMVVDSFSSILSKDSADFIGRNRVKKLSELIPRQQFDIPIQAAIGSRILSRETVKALRKDVTAKLYGGDVTRKRKLLEKQKEGKKKMRNIGSVEVPKEAFKEFLKQ